MDRRTLLRLLVLPTLVGLVSTAVAYVYLSPGVADPNLELVPAVRVRQAVPAKTVLTEDMLVLDQVPAKYVSRGVVGDVGQAVGRVTLVPLAEGEMVIGSRLAGEENPAGMAYRLPEGHRAFSIRVDEVTGAGGFVQPGDRVDVIAIAGGQEQSGDAAAGEDRGRAILLLEGLLVMAVNTDMDAEPTSSGRAPDAYSYLTLAVTPEQALDLAVAQAFARIHVALRPATGGGERSGRLTRTTDILGR